MGVLWSSPYRLQVFVICLGLLLLTAAFVLLLLSIGLADFHCRLVGGLCASAGSALLVLGSCWCVWVVRRGRFIIDTRRTVGVVLDSEAQTLTSDTTWREEQGLDGPCVDSAGDDHELGPDDDFETDDDSDDENDDIEEEEDEHDDSLGPEVCAIDQRYQFRDRSKTVLLHHRGIEEDPGSVETKKEESRLIPV